jgi:glyoxylate reductase
VRPKVFVSRRLPERVRAELEARFEVTAHDSEWPPSREEMLAQSKGCDGLLTIFTDGVDEELLAAAGPGVRVVANFGAGYDNVDLDAAGRRGVLVTNTPDVLSEAAAEFTIALLLALTRRVAAGDRLLRRREPWAAAPTFMLAPGVRGRTLGIVGLGRIGREVARLAGGLGMEVVYTNRSGPLQSEREWLPLGELLVRAHVVTLHVPLTAETRHLLGAEAFRAMRPDAVLVNTARGAIIDEEALADALVAGEIAGAALDVFEREPEVSPRLLGLENVVLAPHLASATHETREAMGMLCVAALEAVLLDGRCPPNAVNPEVWPSA